MSAPVICVGANPALDEALETFQHALKHNGKGAEAYIHFMGRLTDRIIALYLIEPVEIAGVSSTQRKIVDFAVDTGSKASSMLTSQIYKKVSNAQFAPIARDLTAMYWPACAANGDEPQLCYPADAAFARDFQTVIDAAAAGQARTQMPLLMKVLDRLVDDVLQKFFLDQTRHVDIGFITKKALDVSVAGTRSACHAVMHKVVKELSDAQIREFMAHNARALKNK